ncbi:MAG: ankyrin repeat domain-containing protein [Acidobacteria bacterium]|nr:ankyrin repeat domain-containing protein [Acidobacteriota bacterium]
MHRVSLSLVAFVLVAVPGGVEAARAVVAADAGLISAIRDGDGAGVRTAIERGVDVMATDPDGTTPLHWATHADDAGIVEQLLAAGADPEAANRYGVRPISLACTNGNAAVVEALLDAGADPDAALAEGETALMTAARTGALDVVRLLLDRGANVNAAETWRGQTALMWAAAEGHAHLIPTMLSHGADVAARSTKGWTPLLFAVREGRIGVVQTLLEAGASVEQALPVTEETRRGGTSAERAATGLNAFLLAAANAHYELAALLVDRGADVNVASRGWTALHQVSWVRKAGIAGSNNPPPPGSGNMTSLEFVRKLVAAGADVNARVTRRPPAGITRLNFLGGTPFLLAARTGDADLMRLLAELGADPILPNEDNTTPIMVAAGVGTSSPGEDPGTEPEVLEAVQVALELGGDLNHVDDNGETVMHGAAYKHLPGVVRFLAEVGADVDVWNQPNSRGWTPLEIVAGVHRGMNIQSSPVTADAVRAVMDAAGVPPPAGQ